MQYRARAKAGPRLGLLPTLIMIVLALVVAGAIFVGFRVLFAPRPRISLGAPFNLVGRNRPLVLDVKDGPGELTVTARNVSWGGFFKGRTSTFSKSFTARLVPPRIEVLTRQHYVNQ